MSVYLGLSDREQSILAVLCTGAENKEIARELGIADGTVKVHLKSICKKLKVRNRTQIVIKALTGKVSGLRLVFDEPEFS